MTTFETVIDTDIGVDDALAVVLAANSPELDVVAITTVAGNAEVRECSRNSLLLAAALWGERRPIVAEGAAAPIDRALTTAPEVHGEDGLGGAKGSLPEPPASRSDEPAHRLLVKLASSAPGRTTLVATGPLTNLALAHRESPGALARFRRIVVMGGAFDVPGNTGPVAEFNFYVDPIAADIVLGLGLDVTLVPLDVTTTVGVARDELERMPRWSKSLAAAHESTPATRHARAPRLAEHQALSTIIARALDHYMRYQASESGLDAGYMHDPVALCAALAPGLLGTREIPVGVVLRDADRGRSVEARDGRPPVRVAFNADAAAIRKLIRERALEPLFG